jgi:hypothetical protein
VAAKYEKSTSSGARQGVYGFYLDFPEETEECADLVPVAADAPTVTITRRHASPLWTQEEVSDDRVVLANRSYSGVVVERRPARIQLDQSVWVGIDGLVHPILTTPLAMLARWRGDVTIHAGAFETEAGAWGIVGRREAGKSTMLALLAARGHPIVADDLLAIQDGVVWAGPDCVDLRPETAERFDARYLGEITGRPRFRLSTPPSRSRLPLKGVFLLDWSDDEEIDISPLSARESLGLFLAQEYIYLLGWPGEHKVLEAAAVPAWRVRRPRDWDAAQDVVDRVLEATASVS